MEFNRFLGQRPTVTTIPATEENIWTQFERAGKVLGHGLHDSYANRPEHRGDINLARLELHYIVNDPESLKALQRSCETEFDRLWNEWKDEIGAMKPAVREEYQTLRRRGGRSNEEAMIVAQTIEAQEGIAAWGRAFVRG